MKFDYLRLALGLVKALSHFLMFLREKELLDAGEARAVARIMQEASNDIARAEKARDEIRKRNAAIDWNSKLPDDDFRRD
jgi:hypothetical protein